MITNDTPRVSVIVAGKNEANSLDSCLNSLCELDFESYEVIYVDGGSIDDSRVIFDKVRQKHPKERIVWLDDPGSNPAGGRNLGIRSARGTFLAFVDADVVVPEDWLTIITNALTESAHGGVAGVGGPILPRHTKNSDLIKAMDLTFASPLGSGSSAQFRAWSKPRGVPAIPTANCLFLADVVRKVGGFDPRLRYAEDSDLSYKIRKDGFKLKYIPAAFAYHFVKYDSVASFASYLFGYGQGRGTSILYKRGLVTVPIIVFALYSAVVVASAIDFLILRQSSGLTLFIVSLLLLLFTSVVKSFWIFGRTRSVKLALLCYLMLIIEYTSYCFGLVSALLRRRARIG